jgi:trigger factor
MIENRIDEMIKNLENKLKYQKIPLDSFLRNVGQTEEGLRESYREGAIKHIKIDLALKAVAKKENLTATEEEVNAEVERLTTIYSWDKKDKSNINRDYIADEIAARKDYDFVMEKAIEIS